MTVRAAKPLVAIAGGGIAGLAAALALAEKGFGSVVFERSTAFGETGAGLQLSPNATRVLARLGVLPLLRGCAVEPAALVIRRGLDGRRLARMPLGAVATARYGAPLLVASRADLHRALLARAAASAEISLVTGTAVTGWHASEGALGLDLAPGSSGAPPRVGALIGADGVRSRIRHRLLGRAAAAPTASGRVAWRATIPSSAVPEGFCEPETNLWLGPDAHIVHYPVAAGTAINVVAVSASGANLSSGGDDWSQDGNPADLARRFAAWCRPARDLLASSQAWRVWPLLDLTPLPRWCDGPVTLVGDAAHAMLPFLAQGAAQAIEDAPALAGALAASPADPGAAFKAYEGARRRRTALVQRASRRQGRVAHLAWPFSTVRDTALRRMSPDRFLARYDWLYGCEG